MTAALATRHVPAASLVPGDRILPRAAWSGPGRVVSSVSRTGRRVAVRFSPVLGSPGSATYEASASVPVAERVPTHLLTGGALDGTGIRFVDGEAYDLTGDPVLVAPDRYAPHPAWLLGEIVPGCTLEAFDDASATIVYDEVLVTVEHTGAGTYLAVLFDMATTTRVEVGGRTDPLTRAALVDAVRNHLTAR